MLRRKPRSSPAAPPAEGATSDTVLVLPRRGHALQARRSRTARESEQHRLGLVVEGVAEQHGRSTLARGNVAQRRVSGVARGGLRPVGDTGHLDPGDERADAESLGFRGSGCRGIR